MEQVNRTICSIYVKSSVLTANIQVAQNLTHNKLVREKIQDPKRQLGKDRSQQY